MTHHRRRYQREPYGQHEAWAVVLALVMLGCCALILFGAAAAVLVWPHANDVETLYMR